MTLGHIRVRIPSVLSFVLLRVPDVTTGMEAVFITRRGGRVVLGLFEKFNRPTPVPPGARHPLRPAGRGYYPRYGS